MKEILGDERLLTFNETLQHLRISKSTLYRFMQSGQIQGYKVGSTWRFYHKDVKALVRARCEMGKVDTGKEEVEGIVEN